MVRPAGGGGRDALELLDIVVDPGQAFGTGAHATTRLCLELLLELGDDAASGALVDLGCGSGVLAIAAAKLGWGPILGIDHEHASGRRPTRENAQANGVAIDVRHGDLLHGGAPAPSAPTVVANLLRPLLAHVARVGFAGGAPPHVLIVSGLLRARGRRHRRRVRARARAARARPSRARRMGGPDARRPERTMTAGFRGPERITDPATLEAIYRLRVEVWRETAHVSAVAFADGRWCDAVDATAVHWAISSGGDLVAAGRLSVHERLADVPDAEEYGAVGLRLAGPIAAPAHFVVAARARGHGLTGRLREVWLDAARAAGSRFAVCQASPEMCRIARRRGWYEAGPAAADERFPGVPFVIMVLELGS